MSRQNLVKAVSSSWTTFWHSLTGRAVVPPVEAPPDRRRTARVAANVKVILRWEETGSKLHSTTAAVRDVSDTGMSLACTKAFSSGQTVWVIRKSAPALKAIVRHCEHEQGLFILGLTIVVNERRRADRFPSDGKGVLSWPGELGEQFEADAKVADLSDSGMQLVVNCDVPVGIIARLVGDRVICVGTIRYCRPKSKDEAVVGFQFVQEPYARHEVEALDLKIV